MICEMYIDDCSVFGDTNIEFVLRLRLVFERFRKHNLYLKANTLTLPLVEIIYSGEIFATLDYILVHTAIILIENIRHDSTVMRNK